MGGAKFGEIQYYNFNPQFITNDFGQANLSALETVFEDNNVIIITCFFHLVQAWWKKVSKLGLRRKNYIKKTKMLIFNLEMLPFMEYEKANKYYIQLKNLEEFDDDIYTTFFSYFEKTWFTCNAKKNKTKSKFPFSLWSYYEKLNKSKLIEGEFSKQDYEHYISYTNNFCESLNSYIKTFIPINKKVSLKLFIEVIKNLFTRNSLKRMKGESIKEKKIPLKRNISDVFIDILEITEARRIIRIDEINNIKHHLDEDDLFDLKEILDDNENEIKIESEKEED